MGIAAYFFCILAYIFIYRQFARAAYRQKLAEDEAIDTSSGLLEEIERSFSVSSLVLDFDAPLDGYSKRLIRSLYTARALLILSPVFAIVALFFV